MKRVFGLFAKTGRRPALGTVVGVGLWAALVTASGRMATLAELAAGADRVVVATARSVTPEWRVNIHGDRIIVSRVQLEVAETLKGATDPTVAMEFDGGTLDGLTLQVSSQPLVQAGERAVFFLDAGDTGIFKPYLRGQGILMLDERDVVRGSQLQLGEIRSTVLGRRPGQ